MFDELSISLPGPDVFILGVNDVSADFPESNSLIVAGRVLPWLQDTVAEDAWGDWQVTLRDTVVLDRENKTVAVYNLTSHDLANPVYYEELKTILEDAAAAPPP